MGLNFGLGSIPLLSNAQTRSISAENPNGAKGGGAKVAPQEDNAGSELGKGWKVRPCITVKAGETVTLADIDGPGVIQHKKPIPQGWAFFTFSLQEKLSQRIRLRATIPVWLTDLA